MKRSAVELQLSRNKFQTKAPLTRYNLLSNRLSNRFDNQVNVCIHDTTGCQTRCQTGCTTRLTTGLTTGWMFVYTIQPVVNPVVQPVWQPVVSCKRGLTTRGYGRPQTAAVDIWISRRIFVRRKSAEFFFSTSRIRCRIFLIRKYAEKSDIRIYTELFATVDWSCSRLWYTSSVASLQLVTLCLIRLFYGSPM